MAEEGFVMLEGVCWDALPVVESEGLQGVLTPWLDRASIEGEKEKKDVSERLPGLKWYIETDPHVIQLKILGTKRRMMVPMLRDQRRNEAFQKAIENAVHTKTSQIGHGPRVLDIGTGTSLLALMAGKAGSSHVLGCEMNPPLADIARQIVGTNNLDGQVEIVAHRSTSLQFQEQDKVDIIVTETLDSNLLDEGIIDSVQSALAALAKEDAVVIPGKAKVFGQIFHCKEGELEGICSSEIYFQDGIVLARERSVNLSLPEDEKYLTSYHPNQIPGLTAVSEPFEIFDIDFVKPGFDEHGKRYATIKVPASSTTNSNAEVRKARFIIMWWDLEVASNVPRPEEGDQVAQGKSKRKRTEPLSTNPFTSESDPCWQDHWFPVIIPLRRPIVVESDKLYEFHLSFSCSSDRIALLDVDAFSFSGPQEAPKSAYFGAGSSSLPSSASVPFSVNSHYHKEKMAQFANVERTKMLKESIEAAVESLGTSVGVLDVSDGSLCALLASSVAEVSVSLEQSEDSASFWRPISEKAVSIVTDPELLRKPFEAMKKETEGLSTVSMPTAVVICSELYYESIANNPVLCAFLFLFQVQWLTYQQQCPPKYAVVPSRSRVVGSIVRLGKLAHSMRAPESVHGFDHQPAAKIWNEISEMFPVPLWSYEHTFETDEPFDLIVLDNAAGCVQVDTSESPHEVSVALSRPYPCGVEREGLGLLVWVETDCFPTPNRWYDKHLLRLLHPDSDQTTATILNLARFTVHFTSSTHLTIQTEVL